MAQWTLKGHLLPRGAEGVYRQMSCQGIYNTKSVALVRFLTQPIEAPKKRNRSVTHKKKKQKRKRSKIETQPQFPHVVTAQYEPHIAADIHLQNYCAWEHD